MNMHSEIKVWKLTTEQLAAYKPGMDLGEPDRVEQARPREITPFNGRITTKRTKKENPKKKESRYKNVITRDEYVKLSNQGMTDKAITQKFGLSKSTMRRRKIEWGLRA